MLVASLIAALQPCGHKGTAMYQQQDLCSLLQYAGAGHHPQAGDD